MDRLNEQFGEIYDQYIDKIYRFVYLKVNSQETAEDITSKVFTKGWESYKNQPIDNVGAFLYQIARNSVVDHYREKGRTKIVSAENNPNLVDLGASAHEKAILASDIENIKLAISKIKKDYQDVIIWHYVNGMKVTEIAQIMEKPQGTVRVMLHRGLKELKSVIKS